MMLPTSELFPEADKGLVKNGDVGSNSQGTVDFKVFKELGFVEVVGVSHVGAMYRCRVNKSKLNDV